MASEQVALDQTELRAVYRAIKGMNDEAKEEAKRQAGALADFAQRHIFEAAGARGIVASRIAKGSKVKKSSTTGEITYGFASQKFSGGATTKDIWGGEEFGSNKYKQFPIWSGKYGRGSKGWFIYPTLRMIQPEIIARWNTSFDKILKEWT